MRLAVLESIDEVSLSGCHPLHVWMRLIAAISTYERVKWKVWTLASGCVRRCSGVISYQGYNPPISREPSYSTYLLGAIGFCWGPTVQHVWNVRECWALAGGMWNVRVMSLPGKRRLVESSTNPWIMGRLWGCWVFLFTKFTIGGVSEMLQILFMFTRKLGEMNDPIWRTRKYFSDELKNTN